MLVFDAQRLGGEADDEVLRYTGTSDDSYIAVESRDALERRDLRLWRKFSWVGSSYQHAGGREYARQPRRKAFAPQSPESETGLATPSRADGAGCAGLRRQPFGEADARPHHRPPDDPP